VTELAGRSIGRDMYAVEEDLTVFDSGVAVAQVDAMLAQRLDLGADERESALQRFLDEEIVARLAIVGYQIVAILGRLGMLLDRHAFIRRPSPSR